MKIVTNTIVRGGGQGGGFDSPGMALRERNNTKWGSRTWGKAPRGSKPPKRRPSATQQKRKGGFSSLKATPRERISTKGGLKTPSRALGSSRPLENNH